MLCLLATGFGKINVHDIADIVTNLKLFNHDYHIAAVVST